MRAGYLRNRSIKIAVAMLLCLLMMFGTIMPMSQVSYAAEENNKSIEMQAASEEKGQESDAKMDVKSDDQKEDDDKAKESTEEETDPSGDSNKEDPAIEGEPAGQIKENIEEEPAPKKGPLRAGGQLDGLVETFLEHGILNSDGRSIDSPVSIADGNTLTVTEAKKYIKLTVHVYNNAQGTSIKNKDVSITIPRGLELIKATGVASVNKGNTNGSYNRGEYTPTEALYLTDYSGNTVKYPTWAAEPHLYDNSLANNFETVNTSGKLSYSLSDGVSDGVVEIYLRANPYFAQPQALGPSIDTLLKDIKVEVTGKTDAGDDVTDKNTFGVNLKSAADGTWWHNFSIGAQYAQYWPNPTVSYGMAMNPLANVDKNPFGRGVNDQIAVTNLRTDVTYPTGGIFTPPSGWTVASETINDNGTTTVHLTRNETKVWIMSGNTTVGSFTIKYPEADFPVGSTPRVTISNMEYDAIRYHSDTDKFTTEHEADRRGTTYTNVTIVKVPDTTTYRVTYSAARADTEQFNDYLDTNLVLTQVRRNISNPLPNNAVRLRCDVDTENNNVRKIEFQSPVISNNVYGMSKGAKLTKIVVKYEGEDEITIFDKPGGWATNTHTHYGSSSIAVSSGAAYFEWKGNKMPGASGPGYEAWGHANSKVMITAPAGKTYEYAYIELDSDNTYSAQDYSRTYGRPKLDEYTGVYSRDKFSSYYKNDDGEWIEAKTWQQTGFRYKKPEDPKLTFATAYYGSTTYEYNHTECGYDYPWLGYMDIKNDTGSQVTSKLKLSVDIDPKDAVRLIQIPYNYNEDANAAAESIASITYKLRDDPTIYTWTKESGAAAPFSNKNKNYAYLIAPSGGIFESFEVVLDGWSRTNETSTLALRGYLTNGVPDGTRSDHKVTVVKIGENGDPDEEEWTGNTGRKFVQPTAGSVDPVTVNTLANAGTRKDVTFTVRGGAYTAHTFAIVLPKGITLENMYANNLKNNPGYNANMSNQRLAQDSDGATMTKISERDATAEEVASIFGTDNPEVSEATVYYYDLYDQGTYLRSYSKNGNDGYKHVNMSYTVHAIIRPKATYQDAQYSFDKLVYLGTNLTNYSLGRFTGGGPTYGTDDTHRSVANTIGVGKSNNIITGHSGSYLRIAKKPALFVDEYIKTSSSEYMYYDGDEKNIARFDPDENGTIKSEIYNTVAVEDYADVENYLFIPLPKKNRQILSTEHQVDMKVNGALSLTAGDYDDASYEVKYISGANYTSIPVESAASIFNGGSNAFSDDTNLIAVKVKGLKPDGSMTFELPIKAPSYIQQEYAYNQMGAQTAYVYQSANGEHSYASFRCSEEDNMLRLSYRYPEWDLKFQNLKDNGDGTVSELTEPVISDITNIRDNDPVLKHGTTGDYPNLKILAADPVLISHTFGGYFLDKGFTKPFVPYDGTNPDEATKITADTTIYVKWVEDPCQLTVSKIISDLGGDGGYANLNDEFTLTINIKAADGDASIHSEFEYEGAAIRGVDKPDDGKLTIDSDGNATITLKHGQSIIIKGLLREQRVTVTETEKDNYEKPTISITGKDDLEAYATGQFALSEDETTVKFSNKYTSVTPTGVGSASMVFVYIIIGLILIAAALYLIRRKFV